MSPTSTARHPSTLRKIALCAAALVVTLLPTACGAAYADDYVGNTGVVEVGGPDAAEPDSDNGDAADGGEQDAGQNDDQNADAGGDDVAAGDDNAQQGDDAAEQGANDGQNQNGQNDKGQGETGRGNGQNNGQNNGQGNENGQNNGNGKGNEDNNGLDVLGRDCSNSNLEPHNGFEEAPRCVDTAFGEVAAEDKSPSLLITESPQTVKAGEDFELSVSTRNLVRDRFLGAAAGGYYLESSFLNGEGIQRGHFHTACRMLESTDEAPDAAPEPEFFLATQDNGGGAGEDKVKITVEGGMPSAGTAQCAVWAGDGSHRIPMMQRANQTPAFDAVRITIQ